MRAWDEQPEFTAQRNIMAEFDEMQEVKVDEDPDQAELVPAG